MEKKLWRQMGLKDTEYEKIREDLGGRDPNFVELGIYSVMWSEHCSYKHSRRMLRSFPTSGERVLQGPGENAGVLDIGDGLAVAFKIESHNHPSAIEPYQGAATGVGGILRDIFTMGARPVALLNSLRFGPPDTPRARYLIDGIIEGIGGYGNCVGVPTVAGEVYFEECYRENPLVNAMAVGIMTAENLVRGVASGEGNLVVLVGARTGRDGIHGVTFASEELSEESEEKRPAVQVGDPFTEKLLIEACLEIMERKLAVGVQDLGGAGLSCAVTETASRGGTGLQINLDNVPCREEGMEPYEIMLSESQERMLLIIEEEKLEECRAVFERWKLAFSVMGRVTGDGYVRITHGGKEVASVPARSVADGAPEYDPESREAEYYHRLRIWDTESVSLPEDYDDVLKKLLSSPNIASKEWVYRRYDHMVRTSTVVPPGSADAAVLRLSGTEKGLAVTVDGNGLQTYLDPYRGGMMAVAEASRNLSCTGAEPLGITDCLNFGNPEKPEIFWQFRRAVEGMSEACRCLGLPVVGGNVSFYNEAGNTAIYPTPVVGAVGLLDDVTAHATMGFKNEGDMVLLLGAGTPSLSGSEYLKTIHGTVAGALPELDLEQEKALQELVRNSIREGLLSSAHDLSEGGLAVALAESCIRGGMGAVIDLPDEELRADNVLFGEAPSRIIISVEPGLKPALEKKAAEFGIRTVCMGVVAPGSLKISVNNKHLINLPIQQLDLSWRQSMFDSRKEEMAYEICEDARTGK